MASKCISTRKAVLSAVGVLQIAIYLLLGLLGPLVGVQQSQGLQHGPVLKDGVVFKFQGEIYFSDEWVVVTDVSLGSIVCAITQLRRWFTMISKDDRGAAGAKDERLSTMVKDRAAEWLELLGGASGRYQTLREALVGPSRSKRGLMDAGGSVLQWLFGVAASRELEGLDGQLQL